jgi:hypothetical protein
MFAASKSGKAAVVVPATSDPFFSYVPLLLETTSTNGQQNNTFLDSSTNSFTITRSGTPTQGSVTPYYPVGYWSNYFSGSTYLTRPNINFSTNAFTIEAWFYSTTAISADLNLWGMTNGLNVVPKIELVVSSTQISMLTGSFAADLVVSHGGFNPNTWYNISLVRTGTSANQVTIYLNGTALNTTSTALGSLASITGTFNIGYLGEALTGSKWTGYVSNFRIVNGTAITPTAGGPTTPYSTSTTNQVLLTCYGNRLFDYNTATTASTITVTGPVPTQVFKPLAPTASYTTAAYGGSGYFGGSSYLTVPDNAAFDFGSGSFTIEAWVYFTASSPTEQEIFGKRATSAVYAPILFGVKLSGSVFRSYYVGSTSGSGWEINSGFSSGSIDIQLNAWNHIAVVRNGTTFTSYVNGASDFVVSGISAALMTNSSTTAIAASAADGSNNFIGYLSNLRVVKGTAVYTGAFTPPTLAPITTSGSGSAASYSSTTNVNITFTAASTSLLVNATNAGIYDAAAQNNQITVGDAQSSTTQFKWSPTSMKFDGTGDWLTSIDNPQLQLGISDFTIEGWVYLSAISVAYGIISKGTATTGWSVNVTALNKLQFSYTASTLTGATSLATGTWYYFAVVRSGSATGNLKIYLNGSVDATSGGAVTDTFNQTSILYVGADRIGTSALNGYLQDIRITKVARTITTPTAAFLTK